MKKFALLAALFILIASPAYAFTPPTQGTDNATDVVLWHGGSANVTLTMNDFTENAKYIADTISEAISDAASSFATLIISLVVMLGLAGLGYWRGDRGLFLVSSLGFLVYGFSYWSASWQFSLLMVLAGMFLFFRTFSSKGRE